MRLGLWINASPSRLNTPTVEPPQHIRDAAMGPRLPSWSFACVQSYTSLCQSLHREACSSER